MMTKNTDAAELPLIQIKCRFNDAVRFEGRFASMRACVEAAVSARADLAGADLARADLAGAYLAGAYLAGADLAGADLARADLARANLAGADLARAYLARANLARANLAGAYLDGANLAGAYLDGAKVRMKGGNETLLVGARPLLQIGPLGSRLAVLTIMLTEAGLLAQTGCFGPASLAEFYAAVAAKHGDNEHGRAYRSASAMAVSVLGRGA